MKAVLKRLLYEPGSYFFQNDLRRWLYKSAAGVFARRRVQAGRATLALLPAVDNKIGECGYLILPPKPHDSLRAQAISAAEEIVAWRSIDFNLTTGPNRATVRGLLMQHDLLHHRAILNYGLSDELISPAADSLGQLPVMPYIFIWRSVPSDKRDFKHSQMWHMDYSDTTQIKVFVFLEDINEQHGPLTLINAPSSQRLRKQLRYNYLKRRFIPDAEVYRLIDRDKDVVKLTGKKGTVVIANTSRCFHYGSRVQEGMRHILVYRYMTYTSFLANPFSSKPFYPLGRFAQLDGLSPLQKAVLTGMPQYLPRI
ncbi:MAG: hypothetical protein OYH77_07870 [Pseudomonadota bacterium]|nr:hypothetical protein [Pseudomonadota bacterium]